MIGFGQERGQDIVEQNGSPPDHGDGDPLRPAAARHPLELAVAVLRAGRLDEAQARVRAILEEHPQHPDALHLLGVIALHGGDAQAAATSLARAVAIEPGNAAFHSDLGNAFHACGDADGAVRCFATAVELAPEAAPLHFNLGNALNLKGLPEDALPAYRRAIEMEPDNPVYHNNLGNTYQELGRLDEAARALEQAVALEPRYVDALYNLGLVHEAREDHEAAIEAYRRVLDQAPGHLEAQHRFVERLLLAGRSTEALTAADAGLAQDPANVNAMVMKATVLAGLGDEDAERAFVDFDRLIWRTSLESPGGYADLAAFNRALADHVRDHPTLETDPPDHTTRSGKQSGDLLDGSPGPMHAWSRMIDAAVADYLAQLPWDRDHPYLARRPSGWSLSAWGVVLSRQGHQFPHTHPSGWVSGVYYVRVPETVHDPERHNEGWIEFGRPDPRYTSVRDPRVTLLEPVEGDLILFPSFLWHRTIPFEADDERISIAFDAYPSGTFITDAPT